ncbi:VOC family protein [Nocardioides convexus]|uniref:VOC family protein n=1 Tax=Nocardioides convexus TaxID=2712224 RepID=UPI0024183A1B|nr:VOC family protein [Nocardioides convexus]
MTLTSSRIQPCLWFDDTLAEAARFYTSIFPNSSIGHLTPMVGEFTLDGVTFRGINGGPALPFTEAVSFAVTCRDQSEVDYYWDSLADGGQESVCGWLRDRFGLSWQIVPERLYESGEQHGPGPRGGGHPRDARHAPDRRLRVRRPRPRGDRAHSADRARSGLASSLSFTNVDPHRRAASHE